MSTNATRTALAALAGRALRPEDLTPEGQAAIAVHALRARHGLDAELAQVHNWGGRSRHVVVATLGGAYAVRQSVAPRLAALEAIDRGILRAASLWPCRRTAEGWEEIPPSEVAAALAAEREAGEAPTSLLTWEVRAAGRTAAVRAASAEEAALLGVRELVAWAASAPLRIASVEEEDSAEGVWAEVVYLGNPRTLLCIEGRGED